MIVRFYLNLCPKFIISVLWIGHKICHKFVLRSFVNRAPGFLSKTMRFDSRFRYPNNATNWYITVLINLIRLSAARVSAHAGRDDSSCPVHCASCFAHRNTDKCVVWWTYERGRLIHLEDVIFHSCGRKVAKFATFVRPCERTKVASVGYFLSTEFLCFFYFLPTKDLAPFLYMPTKKTPLTHKLSIPQLNQVTFDLPGSAIIHLTHKPS